MRLGIAEPADIRKRTFPLGRVVVFVGTATNLIFSFLIARTILHARAGTLQAQEDLGLFMLIVAVSGPVAITCLLTLVVGALLSIRTLKYDASLFRNPVFTLGILNTAAPLVLVYLLRGSSVLKVKAGPPTRRSTSLPSVAGRCAIKPRSAG